jgi:hypothetical protein
MQCPDEAAVFTDVIFMPLVSRKKTKVEKESRGAALGALRSRCV